MCLASAAVVKPSLMKELDMRSYIVLISPACGGAENRFFDIFVGLREQGVDVVMIAPSSLIKIFLENNRDLRDLASVLLPVDMPSWSPLMFLYRWFRLLRTLPRGSSFHYPMNCLWPLHFGRGDRVSMSVTHCREVPGCLASTRHGKWTWLSFAFVKRVDVLSPGILSAMSDYRTARKMTLTPGGTFLRVMPPSEKGREPVVVLLSRLVEGKGIDDLLDVLPRVWRALAPTVPERFKFAIAGYGSLESHLVERIADLSRSGVPIAFLGFADARILFSRVAIVLSMQETTNYPSRVVAEALSSGCAVIVRNTGDSIQFGTDLPGLFYCSADLVSDELANMIGMLVTRAIHDAQYSKEVSRAAVGRFSSNVCIDYFRNILGSDEALSLR